MATYHLPPTPHSQAISEWVEALRAADAGGSQAVLTAPVPPMVASAQVGDFKAAFWEFDSADALDAFDYLEGRTWMAFSSDLQHLALMHRTLAGPVLLWIGGQPIAPSLAHGRPVRFELDTAWLHGHVFATHVGLPYHHPWARDQLAKGVLVHVEGFFFYDAVRRCGQLALPRDDQAWTASIARAVGDRILVYATKEDRQEGRVGWVSDPLPP